MRKTIVIKQYQLPVKIKKDGDGFIAFCPSWTDCYAQGDTIDEVVSEINSVASSLVELYQEENLNIPLKVKAQKRLSQGFDFDFPLFVSA